MLHMAYMQTQITGQDTRRTAIHALAVVGFVALIGASIWLAVYSTRFVPSVVNNIGSAAVYLGSLFTRAPVDAPSAAISTPTASTTIQIGGENPVATQPATKTKPISTTAGAATGGTYQIGTSTPQGAALSGLPDLITIIDAVGYLTSTSTDSFIASSTVPGGARVAVRFTIKNVGTNTTGAWRWSASIPTESSYIYQSQPQQSLAPGDRIEYTLGFDQAIRGFERTISVSANFDRTVAESNPNNNSASTKITVLGN